MSASRLIALSASVPRSLIWRYSPVIDSAEIRENAGRIWADGREIPGIDYNVEGQLALLEKLAPFVQYSAFLQFNSTFEVMLANAFLAKYHSSAVVKVFPRFLSLYGAGSLWIRRRRWALH
jgi:hypothetical protein